MMNSIVHWLSGGIEAVGISIIVGGALIALHVGDLTLLHWMTTITRSSFGHLFFAERSSRSLVPKATHWLIWLTTRIMAIVLNKNSRLTETSEDVRPLFGLYTCPSNTVYIPLSLIKPTDFVGTIRALLIRRAQQLYGEFCNILPPFLRIPTTVQVGCQ